MRSAIHPRALLLITLAGIASFAQAAETATATITPTQLAPATWQYDLTLNDTGTTDVGTFWFSWVPGKDFMPTAPSDIASPASWTDIVTNGGATDGYAIQWVAGAGAALTPGASVAGFQFDSTASPADMAGDSPFYPTTPVLTSVVYSAAPFSDDGFDFVVTEASPAAPEPANIALAALALGAFFIVLVQRRRSTARTR